MMPPASRIKCEADNMMETSPSIRPNKRRHIHVEMVDAGDDSVTAATPGNIANTMRANVAANLDDCPSPSSSHTEDGITTLGSRYQHLVEAMNEFRQLNINHVMEITELILVGDQSAGKSSVMGALADIHLPKGSGTCTRCPSHILTTPAESWSCDFYLENTYKYDLKRHGSASKLRPTRADPYPPWIRRESFEKQHFATIKCKEEMLTAMKWAQIAILNDGKNYHQYVPGSPTFANDETAVAQFSPNVVSVEIHGPGLPSLSFYDLPGVVNTMGDDDLVFLVGMIKRLVTEYLKRPRTLVLYALPMNVDPQLSTTNSLITETNATSRCVGVLTKPDLAPIGSLKQWDNVLSGDKFKHGHGYFVIKNPMVGEETELTKDFYAVARQEEIEFFANQGPWNAEWKKYSERFGIVRLRNYLSKHLAMTFNDDLPEFRAKIEEYAANIDQKLRELPALPTENRLFKVQTQLQEFSRQFHRQINEDSDGTNFFEDWAGLCKTFCDAIMDMKPEVIISTPRKQKPTAENTVDLTEEEMPLGRSPPQPVTPTFRRVKVEHTGGSGGRLRQGSREDATQANAYDGCRSVNKGMWTLPKLHQVIRRGAGLMPHSVRHNAKDELCSQGTANWHVPIDIFFTQTMYLFKKMIFEVLGETLKHWKHTPLFRECQKILVEYLNGLQEAQRAFNQEICHIEQRRRIVIVQDTFQGYIEAETKLLKEKRLQARAKDSVRDDEERKHAREMKKPLYQDLNRKEQYAKLKKAIDEASSKVKEESLGVDEYEQEMLAAAYARAYYIMAAHRFVENICGFTEGKLFYEVDNDIPSLLLDKLGLGGTDTEASTRCAELLEENDEIAIQRRSLMAEKVQLQKSIDKLDNLSMALRDSVGDDDALDAMSGVVGGGQDL